MALSAGCGGGAVSPATPPADECALLALSDVQTLLPNATAGTPQPTVDTADFWTRDCHWTTAALTPMSIDLVVFGAKTSNGLLALNAAAKVGTRNMPVSGIGERARYWEHYNSDNGLWALRGSYSVDVTAYFIMPFPTADQFKPLVTKALGRLN